MKGNKFFLIAIASFMAFALKAKVNAAVELMPQLSNHPSWSAGMNLEIPLTGSLYLSPGVNYSTRHRYGESLWQVYEYHPDGDIPTDYEKASVNIHADYLTVPLLVGFKGTVSSDNTIKLAGGVYYAYCLGGKSKIKVDYNGDMTQIRVPSYETVLGKRSDFGLCFEVKCLLHRHYQIGLNLQQGLKSIYQTHEVQSKEDPERFHELRSGVKFHQSIGFSVGYVF